MNVSKTVIAALLVLCFSLLMVCQERIMTTRLTCDLQDEAFIMMPGEFATSFIMAGFKGLAADVLWLQIDRYWHTGEWYKMVPLLRIVTWLQSKFIDAWDLASWHLIYNLSSYARNDPVLAADFTDKGVKIAKEGISKNRNRYELYFSLGYYYYQKFARYEDALVYLRRAAAFDVHPVYIDRLLAHAYRRAGYRDKEIETWERCLAYPDAPAEHYRVSRRHLAQAREAAAADITQ